jgi:hypothetical protein
MVEVFATRQDYLKSLPIHKAKALEGLKQSKKIMGVSHTGYHKLVKAPKSHEL